MEHQKPKRKIGKEQWQLFFLVFLLGLAGIFYTLLIRNGLRDSAALYIGLPFLLALGLSLTSKAKNALGATMKGLTIALLLSAFIFQEGYICIIFASPLFYGIGALIAYPIDRMRKRKNKNTELQTAGIALLLALLALEGTTSLTTIPRDNDIAVSKIVNASVADIRTQLSKTPSFDQDKPFFLRIFPYPSAIHGEGIHVGDERKVNFVAYKHIWWSKVEGDLVLKVVESDENRVRFAIAKDDSYLSHYLKWQSSEVTLEPVDADHTKVTWKLSYQRILDPAWYFSPMQHYAVKLAAEELIDHVTTPDV